MAPWRASARIRARRKARYLRGLEVESGDASSTGSEGAGVSEDSEQREGAPAMLALPLGGSADEATSQVARARQFGVPLQVALPASAPMVSTAHIGTFLKKRLPSGVDGAASARLPPPDTPAARPISGFLFAPPLFSKPMPR